MKLLKYNTLYVFNDVSWGVCSGVFGGLVGLGVGITGYMRNEKSTKNFASYLMWKSWHSPPLAFCLLYVIRNSICILYIWYIIRSLNLVERNDVLKFVRKMTYFVEFKKQAFSKTMNVQLIIVITIYIITAVLPKFAMKFLSASMLVSVEIILAALSA